ncbi:MAG: hypothetical protein ACYC99_00465 [Candidatus Geothermincolia bacterium]
MKILAVPKFKIRISPLTYAVLGLMFAEIVLTIMSLSLPWGKTAAGTDIRFGLAGLLPWFGFIPVLLQLGYVAVESRVLQGLYLVANFVIGMFIILVQVLTYLRYSTFEFGFFLVFVLGAVIIATGIVCLVERRVYGRMREKGRAREIPVTFG